MTHNPFRTSLTDYSLVGRCCIHAQEDHLPCDGSTYLFCFGLYVDPETEEETVCDCKLPTADTAERNAERALFGLAPVTEKKGT